MNRANDSLGLVRAGLCDEIDRIARNWSRITPQVLGHQIDAVRATATEFGLLPFAEIARALGQTIADGTRSPLIADYLAALRDAAGCARVDVGAGQAYVASVSVRMVG